MTKNELTARSGAIGRWKTYLKGKDADPAIRAEWEKRRSQQQGKQAAKARIVGKTDHWNNARYAFGVQRFLGGNCHWCASMFDFHAPALTRAR